MPNTTSARHRRAARVQIQIDPARCSKRFHAGQGRGCRVIKRTQSHHRHRERRSGEEGRKVMAEINPNGISPRRHPRLDCPLVCRRPPLRRQPGATSSCAAHIKKKLSHAALSKIIIERPAQTSASPPDCPSRHRDRQKGEDIEKLRQELAAWPVARCTWRSRSAQAGARRPAGGREHRPAAREAHHVRRAMKRACRMPCVSVRSASR